MKVREILLHLVTFALSGASLILGIRNDLWGVVEDDPVHVGFASLGLAVLLILAGERVALSTRLRNTERAIASEVSGLVSSVLPRTRITRFATCDDALIELAHSISAATVILNTRISRDGVQSGNRAHSEYHRALEVALKAGARMVDIVSPAFEDEAQRLREVSQKVRSRGGYEYHILHEQVPCFLNFTVLEFPKQDPEVWIGWATSRAHGLEQPAFRLVNTDIVNYFRAYHAALRT